jgi:hypothetical protein
MNRSSRLLATVADSLGVREEAAQLVDAIATAYRRSNQRTTTSKNADAVPSTHLRKGLRPTRGAMFANTLNQACGR